MKKSNLIYFIFVISIFASSLLSREVLPLSQRFFHMQDIGVDYSRGTYLIVLADSSLESVLLEEETGNFIKFKQTQGYDVKVVDFDGVGGSAANLRYFLQNYHDNIDPLLEYVLLIGDADGLYSITSFGIDSYNEEETDVTDYTYTYRYGEDYLNSDFFIGRWSIRNQDDLRKIKFRTVQYTTMDYITDASYLNKALIVAGNFSDTPPWPVTPVMTSKWLMDELNHFGYSSIDTAFYHLDNQIIDNPLITSVWNDGVGVINYRGWGDANGWHKPYFHNDSIDELFNGLRLPVVFSFVCNTGDFGSSLPKCFGETLITGGSMSNPKGAVAMVGPSDLDTDTRFNNIMCAVMWDEMLEGRIPELAPALHAGKQSLIKEFNDDGIVGTTNIAEFYHHVYGVLGDPSLSVWLGEPKSMSHANILYGRSDTSLFVSTTILGDEIIDVVGALLHDGKLIAKGLSNEMGELIIVFSDEYAGFDMTLYLNKAQYFQEEIPLSVPTEPEEMAISYNYEIPTENSHYRYNVTNFDYEWKSLPDSHIVELSDDTINMKEIGFKFYYYGEEYESLTICSNGWVSFEPCLKHPDENNYQNCNQLAYFFNNSITSPLGPYGMLAPFFDDLDDNEGNEPFNVWYWSNAEDSLIVQWDDVANGQHDEDCIPDDPLSCPRHTFRLILDGNPDSCNEEGCNGDIIFAYESIEDVDNHGSTIGIESPDKNVGTEYLFNYAYHEDVLELIDGIAIKFSQTCDGKIKDNACDCSGNVLDCAGECGGMAIEDICGVCNGDGSSCKLGCTYYAAENYDPDATINDGSCYVLGCMDANSCNYDPNANIDDGNCFGDDDSLLGNTCTEAVDIYGCDYIIDHGDTQFGDEITIKEACPVTCDACSDLAIDDNPLPQTFYLNSFPNPFNPIVKVAFAISEASLSVIDVFDIRGRKLDNLSNQFYSPGYYSVTWDASTYSTGVYFITLSSSETRLTQKILLLK